MTRRYHLAAQLFAAAHGPSPRRTAAPERRCDGCGCTDLDCRQCIKRTGMACHWIGPNRCSACGPVPTDRDAEPSFLDGLWGDQ